MKKLLAISTLVAFSIALLGMGQYVSPGFNKGATGGGGVKTHVRNCPASGVTFNNEVSVSTTCNFASNTAGDALIIWAVIGNPGINFATPFISDTAGNTWSTAYQNVSSASAVTLSIWYTCNAISSAGTNTVTTTAASTSAQIYQGGIEVSGNTTSGCLDQKTNQAQTTASAPTSGNVTTLVANEMLFGAWSGGDGVVTTGAGSGWTSGGFTNNGSLSPGFEYKIVSATGTYAATFTVTGGGGTETGNAAIITIE